MKVFKAMAGSVENYWEIRQCLLNKGGSVFSGIYRKYLSACALITRKHYAAAIPITEKIKPFSTPHGFYGIFISQFAEIGENCTIYQHVTIGSNQLKSSKTYGAPTIGKNVLIGCGAIILGNVTIGDNVNIGAGCIVAQDIPPNCTVVMNRPRILLRRQQQTED